MATAKSNYQSVTPRVTQAITVIYKGVNMADQRGNATERRKPWYRRRRFGFSLKALMALVTLFFIWLGLLAFRVNKQREAVQWVREMGGEVHYDFQWDEDTGVIESAQPPGADWLRDLIGIDYLADVAHVSLDYTEVRDLTPLANLTTLNTVSFNNTEVCDLSPLANLKSVVWLSLSETKVTDLSPLENLTSLKGLWLHGTQATKLKPLAKLARLEYVVVTDTQVTLDEVKLLKQRLPRCSVAWNGWANYK